MTQVNPLIRPWRLPDSILQQEYTSLVFLPGMVISGRAKLDDIPTDYSTPGEQTRFLYGKLLWCYGRWLEVTEEMDRRRLPYRGIHRYWEALASYPSLFNLWEPEDRHKRMAIKLIHSQGFKLNRKKPNRCRV